MSTKYSYKYIIYKFTFIILGKLSWYLKILGRIVVDSIHNQQQKYTEQHGILEGFPLEELELPIPNVTTSGNSIVFGYTSSTLHYKNLAQLFGNLYAPEDGSVKNNLESNHKVYQTLVATVHNQLRHWPTCEKPNICERSMGMHIPDIIMSVPIQCKPQHPDGPFSLPLFFMEVDGERQLGVSTRTLTKDS